MKQHEAVALALEQLGGVATLGQLYEATLKIPDCDWSGTKDPFATIRGRLQTRPEFYRLEAGLWGLSALKNKIQKAEKPESQHSRFQGLAVEVGNLEGFQTYIPPQDKNKRYLNGKLDDHTKIKKIPAFTYTHLLQACSSIDVIWFNERQMPARFLEIEHSTDMYNSLRKFVEFQDFRVEFFIVAPQTRQREFNEKRKATAYSAIASRVKFMDYESLADDHMTLSRLKAKRAGTGF
jgi:hypothetical protein